MRPAVRPVGGVPIAVLLCFVGSTVWAAEQPSIQTDFLEAAWPKERVRQLEVGRHEVRWRQAVSKADGILVGTRFVVPRPPQQTWELANQYSDLGRMTESIESVTYLEDTPTRKVVQLKAKVLWKRFVMTFLVEQDAPETIRFELRERDLFLYRGICRFRPAEPFDSALPRSGRIPSEVEGEQGTAVAFATQIKPAVRAPTGLILLAERIVLLQGIKAFYQACEAPSP